MAQKAFSRLDRSSTDSSRFSAWQILIVLLVGPIFAVAYDGWQWLNLADDEWTFAVLLFQAGSVPYAAWLALGPLAWAAGLGQRSARSNSYRVADGEATKPATGGVGAALVCFVVCSAIGLAVAAGYGSKAADFPPAYHDEYSYLFQAETFLACQVSNPCHELAPLFDQMHVLNRDYFASRYFPGAGLWLAPFVALGKPLWGAWLAQGLTCGFLALAGRRFSALAGWLAGLLAAFSPGMVVFGNTLLATGPTMLAIAVFLLAFPKCFEHSKPAWAVFAGSAIGFAFLTRPLTAVGLGFPYACYALYRSMSHRSPGNLRNLAWMVVSFGAFVIVLCSYNFAVTGSVFSSPYGVYMARHTPCHEFGFYNRSRGLPQRGPDTLIAYDDWAEDLTVARACKLAAERSWSLILQSLGVFSFASAAAVVLLSLHRRSDDVLLLVLSIIGLELAYFPYGFPGLFGFSYIAEAMPAIFLQAAIAFAELSQSAFARRGRWLAIWWLALPFIAVASNVKDALPSIFSPSSEWMYPRVQAKRRLDGEKLLSANGSILILFDAEPKDSLHATLVYNRPGLDGPIVRAWMPRDADQLSRLMSSFPDREVVVRRARDDSRSNQLAPLQR